MSGWREFANDSSSIFCFDSFCFPYPVPSSLITSVIHTRQSTSSALLPAQEDIIYTEKCRFSDAVLIVTNKVDCGICLVVKDKLREKSARGGSEEGGNRHNNTKSGFDPFAARGFIRHGGDTKIQVEKRVERVQKHTKRPAMQHKSKRQKERDDSGRHSIQASDEAATNPGPEVGMVWPC